MANDPFRPSPDTAWSTLATGLKLAECLAFLRDGDVLTVTKPDRLSAQRHFELHGYREGRARFPVRGRLWLTPQATTSAGATRFPADYTYSRRPEGSWRSESLAMLP